jgi:hypothetical protein
MATGPYTQGVKDLIQQGEELFSARASYMSLCQEIAENFYPQRADFTTVRTLGEDFAANLNSSYPLIVHRELSGAIGATTRRKDTEWFKVSVKNADRLDNSGREFLEYMTGVQRSAMYDIVANFETATSQADADYAAFGNPILSAEVNRRKTALLYRCWHLRDVAWCENEEGAVTDRHHNVKPTARWLAQQFGEDKLHQRVRDCLQPGKNPYQRINCRRVVVPAESYDDVSDGRRMPWVSIYIDIDNACIIDQRPSWTPIYIIPRWQTVSGSQYAYSPAVIAGLPDARLIQAMTLTLLEAGEMSVRPPMASAGEVIQGGIQLYAGGITQIDASYDERLGKPLYPILEPSGAMPFGEEMLNRKEEMLGRAFYLNKLRQLPLKDEMTATEASIWTKDYIREALPLFSPLESQYNAVVCEQSLQLLMRENAFGSWQDMPQSLRGMDLEWKFESPLSEAIERQKGDKFMQAKGLITEAMELDPSTVATVDWRGAVRDALAGVGTPAKWTRTEQAVEAHAQAVQQQQAQAAQQQQMAEGAATAVNAGKAVESFAKVA